jgi:hypothetical protein
VAADAAGGGGVGALGGRGTSPLGGGGVNSGHPQGFGSKSPPPNMQQGGTGAVSPSEYLV